MCQKQSGIYAIGLQIVPLPSECIGDAIQPHYTRRFNSHSRTAQMANSYAQIQNQIAELQAQAAMIKQDEVAEVVAKIREAIEVYGLTPDDLFGRRAGAKKVAKAASKTRASGTQYSDGPGKVWGGRGPRPQWLRDALAAGKQLADFAVGGAVAANAEASTGKKAGAKKAAKKPAAKKSGGIRFRDDQGNAWSGFGPKPGWLKAAIEAGKSADDYRV